MNPLDSILAWWQPLENFPREHIAAEVCFRLTDHADIMRQCEMLFREFLAERLPAQRHLGRAVAVRAVIDFFFMRESSEDSLGHHLNNVETAGPHLKELSNAAVGRHLRAAAGRAEARDTWRALRESVLSDAELVAWERDATGHMTDTPETTS